MKHHQLFEVTKTLLTTFAAFVGLSLIQQANAQVFVRGQVEFVRTHDAEAVPSWAPPRSWLTLRGVGSVSDCPLFGSSVLFVINDRQMFSMALAAQMAGKQLTVAVHPTRRVNGWCVVAYLTAGDPPPLY